MSWDAREWVPSSKSRHPITKGSGISEYSLWTTDHDTFQRRPPTTNCRDNNQCLPNEAPAFEKTWTTDTVLIGRSHIVSSRYGHSANLGRAKKCVELPLQPRKFLPRFGVQGSGYRVRDIYRHFIGNHLPWVWIWQIATPRKRVHHEDESSARYLFYVLWVGPNCTSKAKRLLTTGNRFGFMWRKKNIDPHLGMRSLEIQRVCKGSRLTL